MLFLALPHSDHLLTCNFVLAVGGQTQINQRRAAPGTCGHPPCVVALGTAYEVAVTVVDHGRMGAPNSVDAARGGGPGAVRGEDWLLLSVRVPLKGCAGTAPDLMMQRLRQRNSIARIREGNTLVVSFEYLGAAEGVWAFLYDCAVYLVEGGHWRYGNDESSNQHRPPSLCVAGSLDKPIPMLVLALTAVEYIHSWADSSHDQAHLAVRTGCSRHGVTSNTSATLGTKKSERVFHSSGPARELIMAVTNASSCREGC